MKLLFNTTDYEETINYALKNLNNNNNYNNSVIFHCFWHGILNEKHLYSILSCYYFNIYNNNNNKIILWLENNIPNYYNIEIKKYAEIRTFSLIDELKEAQFMNNINYQSYNLSLYSDVVRYVLLYNYGGVWFDLDCLFLRCFNPLFNNFSNDICVYQWANINFPNGAIYISLEPKSNKMKKNILFIIERNRGWGFEEANLTYDLNLDLLVLPCSWFDASWISNPLKLSFNDFFINTTIDYNFDNFFKGAFVYHWHNKWNNKIEDYSPCKRLINIIIYSIHENDQLKQLTKI